MTEGYSDTTDHERMKVTTIRELELEKLVRQFMEATMTVSSKKISECHEKARKLL